MTVRDDTIIWAKIRPDAIIPTKRDEDGWYDLYANFSDTDFIILPHTTRLVPTGIASAFSQKWKITLGERGTNTKSCLILQAGKIDSGWRGEYFVALYNGNDIPVVISKEVFEIEKYQTVIKVPYTKAICQFEITEVPVFNHIEVTYQELLLIKSERGLGCLGSSNK